MKKPLVSVLMPAYNASRYIGEAIESVLSQTFKDFELIIVDDCSTDDTFDIISSFKDKRIRVFRNKHNLKIVGTRNKLFSLVKGKYIAILDSDDVMLPTRLEKQVAFLDKNKEFVLVGSDIILIDSQSKKIGIRKYPKSYDEICRKMLVRNPIAQSSVMMRNKGFSYDPSFLVSEDYALWCEIASTHKVANIGCFVKYRLHETQTVSKRLKEHLLAVLRIQKKWITHKKFSNMRAYIQYFMFSIAQFFPAFILRWLR